MRRLIIAGMHRSGSTWQFNAVRLSLEMSGYEVYGSTVDKYDKRNSTEIHLVKTHEYIPAIIPSNSGIFTSYRNIHEVKASFERRKIAGAIDKRGWNHINRHILNLMKWQIKSSHCTFYDRITEKPLMEINDIQETLRKQGFTIKPLPKDVNNRLNDLKAPAKGFDEITLYNQHHFTSR